MICIKRLVDEDFGIKNKPMGNPRERLAARGIVLNENNKIAIIYKSKKHEYKLVGGGIEDDENPEEAFKREVLEEAGCKINIIDCLGTCEELKSQDNFRQISYVFVANVVEDTGQTNYTFKEKEEGSILLWLDINDAIKYIKESESQLVASNLNGSMSLYHTRFIVRRDYEILKYYKKNL